MRMKEKNVSQITGWLAGFFIVGVIIIFPLGYLFISYQYMSGSLETEAEINANIVSEIIGSNPEFWEFEQVRLTEYLSHRPTAGYAETRRLKDTKNMVVAESVGNVKPPVVTRSHEIMDSGVVVGKIEISRSLSPLLKQAGLITLLMLPLGFGAFIIVYLLPIRAINRAEVALKKANEELETRVIERTNDLNKSNEELLSEITERKQAEDRIKKIANEWSVTFDSMKDLISVHDKDFRIVRVNKAFTDALKMQPEELIGKYCHEIIHKTKEPWPVCPHELALEDKKPHTTEFFEPGWGAYFEVSASPVLDNEGEITGTVHIIRDITERKKTEEYLKESEKSYKELTEVLGDSLSKLKEREQSLHKSRDAFLNMLEDVSESYKQLVSAYETTIDGWSKALDYRDKETEGHSQRVTKITLEIARAIGISEEELVHVRRGALLHDIGKMGVPDEILLKPGKLTDEEWVIMKKHPEIAYELLSPIIFLRPALDVPFCHHEKWNGTGYPRGLKGEQIPLAARIFAAVDVWDALRSDRPYRPAWTEEKTHEYMLSESGIQFDPKVLEVFFRMQQSLKV